MKLNRVVPLLWTNDLDATIEFYRQLLGFECLNRMEGWALLKKDEVELMFSLPNAHEPFDKIQFTGSFYFHPDDVAELWEELRDKAEVQLYQPLSRISNTACASSLSATTTATSCNSGTKSER